MAAIVGIHRQRSCRHRLRAAEPSPASLDREGSVDFLALRFDAIQCSRLEYLPMLQSHRSGLTLAKATFPSCLPPININDFDMLLCIRPLIAAHDGA